MNTAESQPVSTDGSQHPRPAKRTASEDPDSAPDTKRAVAFDNRMDKSDVKVRPASEERRVAIPEKVYRTLE